MAHGLFPQITAHTVTSPDRLRELLYEIREQGWALVDQEFEEGVRSFSAPIRDSTEGVLATLSMSVPAGSLSVADIKEETLPVIVEAAHEISKQLCAPAPS